MAEDWTHARIRKATRKRLADFIERMRTAREQGKLDTPQLHNVDVTIDDAVTRLLDLDDQHRERLKRQREKASKPKVVDPEPPTDEDE